VPHTTQLFVKAGSLAPQTWHTSPARFVGHIATCAHVVLPHSHFSESSGGVEAVNHTWRSAVHVSVVL